MGMKDKLYSAIEYALAALWIYGGINSFFANPLTGPSAIFKLLAGQEAIYAYAILFFLTGAALLAAKLLGLKKWHRISLATMYLTCLYVLILSYLLGVLSAGSLITVLAGVAAAVCWVRWKLKTEYVDPDYFSAELEELRDDLPPKE